MTTNLFFETLTSIVTDLSQDLPAEQRYQQLLNAMLKIFPCDAAALLKLEGTQLRPLAINGLSEDTMGRRFVLDENPRLALLLHSREPIRFTTDSELPDPYDGLVEASSFNLNVHDCMGVSLYIDDQPWGLLTLDAVSPSTFDKIDLTELRTFISLTEATVKAAKRMDALAARAEREQLVAKTLSEEGHQTEIVGTSAPITQLKKEIEIVAQSHLNILILGETGVGKELVARQAHQLSSRASKPLVHINCAALPENIAESELFGHIKGSFSGAIADRAGKFEIADGGTLFLDEIGELPLPVQAKLLRAIQNGDIQRVGSDKHIQVDVRIISATNRNLEQEIAQGRFRTDLFHRLNVYPIQVPPLRERRQDILLLAGYLLEVNQRRLGVSSLRLAENAKQALQQYNWPGNVRELEHLLSRAALKAMIEQGRDSRILILESTHLGIEIKHQTTITSNNYNNNKINFIEQEDVYTLNLGITLKESLHNYQAALVTACLKRHNGNQAATARELGLNRSNFHRLQKRLNS